MLEKFEKLITSSDSESVVLCIETLIQTTNDKNIIAHIVFLKKHADLIPTPMLTDIEARLIPFLKQQIPKYPKKLKEITATFLYEHALDTYPSRLNIVDASNNYVEFIKTVTNARLSHIE